MPEQAQEVLVLGEAGGACHRPRGRVRRRRPEDNQVEEVIVVEEGQHGVVGTEVAGAGVHVGVEVHEREVKGAGVEGRRRSQVESPGPGTAVVGQVEADDVDVQAVARIDEVLHLAGVEQPVLREPVPQVVGRERRRLSVLAREVDQRVTIVLRPPLGGLGVRRREGHGGEHHGEEGSALHRCDPFDGPERPESNVDDAINPDRAGEASDSDLGDGLRRADRGYPGTMAVASVHSPALLSSGETTWPRPIRRSITWARCASSRG